MKTVTQVSINLQTGLILRRGKDALLLDWKSSCNYLNLVVERHICSGIYKNTASCWLKAIETHTEVNCTDADVVLHMSPQDLAITFTRTFLMPNTVWLSSIAQEKLKIALQDFLIH
ncbi:MAG: hypothetical protein K2Y22_10245 [Candidatus Obscuribacterales bacterium]|nr:hypothetical protein [Candidatus Obscuribacterales bacterium]